MTAGGGRPFAGADHVLLTPTVHLRYMWEHWLDKLMAWVKAYYVGDLWYWRYADLPGFDRLLPASAARGRTARHDRTLDELHTELAAEVAGWP